jgi:hypothetical protein
MNSMNLPVRHVLATLAYRLGKVVRHAPPEFCDFRIYESSRTPGQILAHMGDLMDWALAQVEGRKEWHDSEPLPWQSEVDRFFRALEVLDAKIAAIGTGAVTPEKLFQGALADAFTHTGQLALLRRMAGMPVRGENYAAADIQIGRVGSDQAAAVREFD